MTNPHNTTKHLWRVSFAEKCFILLLVALAPLVSSAQTSNGAPLPQDAAEAFDKGVIAAKQSQDYPLAIRHFQDARRLAPGAPVIYLNLGLAESKIPGRELRAIAWFAAYLEANPDAPNAAAVKEQIGILDAKSQGNISRMIKAVRDASSRSDDDKDSILFDVARLFSLSGDATEALKTANLLQNGYNKDLACLLIVNIQTASGDITGAITTVASIQDRDLQNKGSALYAVATTQAEMGNIAEALKTADLIQGAETKSFAQEMIGEAQIKQDDIAGAEKSLASAQKTSDLIQNAAEKSKRQQFIAEAQAKANKIVSSQFAIDQLSFVEAKITAGDIDGALKTIDLIGDDSAKFFGLMFIAGAQTRDGDLIGAQKTIDLVQGPTKDTVLNFCAMIRLEKDKTKSSEYYSQTVVGYHGLVQNGIVDSQLKAGDIIGAQKTTALIHDQYDKNRGQEAIADSQLEGNDIHGALKTAELIQDAEIKSWLQNKIAQAQIKAGDIAGAQRTLAAAQKTVNLIQNASSKTEAQNYISKDQDLAASQLISSDWLSKLDENDPSNDCPLNTYTFLDLASYLRSLPSFDSPKIVYELFATNTQKIVRAQNVIDKKLKEQVAPPIN